MNLTPKAGLISIFLCFVAAADTIRETDSVMYPAQVTYDQRIPLPQTFLGHALGRAPVRHHKLVAYLETVADLSDRISVETIGHSHERRPILFLTITSPANHKRIDEIRARHLALTEASVNQDVNEDMPVVTWLNYGVHGAESSGMDAALPTAYYLAAAQGPEIERILEHSVILLTAVLNPDGHAKRASWFDAFGSRVVVSDPQHKEHDFDDRLLRTNHYGFDLNRQWLLLTQPESRAWIEKWHAWRPNVSVDYHEMGADKTYYFHPGVSTRTHPLIPDEAEALLLDTVRESEDFLDSEARLYYHGESFDNFYIGKGSTYPLVNGAIGILFEASAARGVELDTVHGLRSYRENIRKHFRTSIGSIAGALSQRLELLRFQRRFYDSALEGADEHTVKAYVFDATNDAVRLYRFVDLLRAHRIKAYKLNRTIEVDGNRFLAGTALIVPLRQPQYRMIRGIFDTMTEFEDATFYDVSSWTMPLAFNLNYAALSGRQFRASLMGPEIVPKPPTPAVLDRAPYGYAFAWSGYFAPRALNRILSAGLLASAATKAFALHTTRGPVEFQAGSVFVTFDRQEQTPQEITAVMRTIAAEDGLTVHAVTSGRSPSDAAGVNPGGPSFMPLKAPKVLLVTGREVDLYDAGAAWHLLDFRMRIAVTLRDRDRLQGIDWSRYTHVVFPGGEYEEYVPDYLDELRRWVAHGGTAIGIRQASPWLRAQVLDHAVVPEGSRGAEDRPPPGQATSVDEPEPAERIDYGEKARNDAVDVIGGAIFAGHLDTTHPLGFGYQRRDIAVQKNTAAVMPRPDNPYATVMAYSQRPLLSGYASATKQEALAGTAALIAERQGEGSIILFADDPNFRAIWYGTNKLFLNALFFSTIFAPASPN